tara:strand:+ start:264 stop:527 length:264 start_codon:yes stop_codon:yes gene_type:complete
MIKPHGKRLLIEAKVEKMEAAFGIIIPDEVKDVQFTEGTVLSAGNECVIEEGDYVIYNDYTGKVVEWDGKELIIIDEDEVLAIIEDE